MTETGRLNLRSAVIFLHIFFFQFCTFQEFLNILRTHPFNLYVCCAICCHLYNLKNMKNTHGVVLLLVKLHVFNTPPWCFSHFLNCTNNTTLCNASHMFTEIAMKIIKWYNLTYGCSIKLSNPPRLSARQNN